MVKVPDKIQLAHGPTIRRLVVGLWQMADQERDGAKLDLDHAAEALVDYARAGFDTFDMADHYGSAEIVAGMAAKALSSEGHAPTIMTKWCPQPGEMDLGTVRGGVETALRRLDVNCIDVMQFHWWQYAHPAYLDALQNLMRLREEGLIGAIGLTNVDAQHMALIVKAGVEIATNQVCCSVVDRRATGEMSRVCREHCVGLLAYGSLAGGFLSARSLDAPEPAEIADWSRMKYKRMIDVAGGWTPLQDVLKVMASIAQKHDVSLTNVASRWVLDQDAVAATIIGVRLGERNHRDDNLAVFDFELDEQDHADLDGALQRMDPLPGDCGDEYRKPPFLTASGDLSHHLDALPPVFQTVPMPARPDRRLASSGSIYETVAGFSRAVRKGNRIHVSGTTATDHHGNCVCPDDAGAQAVYILDKIIGAVTSLGGQPEDIVRTRIYMTDTTDWEAVSRAHARTFSDVRPANTLIGIDNIVGPYLVEIEAEAELD